MQPYIELAFRFHVNFYHSYRGDTPNELGFGKDIRVIRHIVEMLDRFNEAGCAIRGTWDIENAFSLGDIMPEHCPDLITALQRRVRERGDEIEVMSYNNGLITAHTAREFQVAIGRAFTNAEGSGLADVFPTVAPVVRPQEMMYTPRHLELYRACGVEAISLFYSAVPFNAFSNFIAPLPLHQRYNPLTLSYPGMEESLTLIPAYNHGDIADHLSLRRWITRLRQQQLEMATAADLLLLIDADADDEYWAGYDWPILGRLLTAAQGLQGLVDSVKDLPYLRFTTPYRYLEAHPPVATVSFGQDTADGNFDGMSSWAEKWSNHRLWTGIERSRILEQQTRATLNGDLPEEVSRLLDEAFESRLRALSTTHFGLAAPMMNRTRLKIAADLVKTAFEAAAQAFALSQVAAAPPPSAGDLCFTLMDYARGVDTGVVTYPEKPSRALVRVPLTSKSVKDAAQVTPPRGQALPAAVKPAANPENEGTELCFVAQMPAGGQVTYDVTLDIPNPAGSGTAVSRTAVTAAPQALANGRVTLEFDAQGHPTRIATKVATLEAAPLLRAAVRYRHRLRAVDAWRITSAQAYGEGTVGVVTMEGTIPLGVPDVAVRVWREYLVAAGLPYVYVTTDIAYPRTPDRVRRPDVARRLECTYDNRWQEVMPCEIHLGLTGQAERPLRVWKHNYLDHVSRYDLAQGTFERPGGVDAFNNQITAGWVAVSDQNQGLLIGQTAEATTCFAFTPMRTRQHRDTVELTLNPFGTYTGRQMSYPTATTGFGKRVATMMAETLRSPAPSYAGHQERFVLMLAPYAGDEPPAQVQADAEAFAAPYALLSASPTIATPGHRTWSTAGLGRS